MADDVRQIVDLLNAPPFSKNLTLISFDGLQPLTLLQILNEVFADISGQPAVSLRDEDPEDTAARMLGQLRVLKYNPPTSDVRAFRQDLIAGDSETIYPILQWSLPRLPDLRKRAYLARFLVRLDVPVEMMQNEEVAAAHAAYVAAMEGFTSAHKDAEALKSAGFSTGDVKKDIVLMEQEREQLQKRIERVRRKGEGLPQHAAMLAAARALRLEHERASILAVQREKQVASVQTAEQKLLRLQQQLSDLQGTRVSGGASGLVVRTEEELQTKRYLCLEKLPRALADRSAALHELEAICNEPALGQSDLDGLHRKLQDATGDINRLTEQRLRAGEGADAKMTLFRQQASMLARKKEATADRLKDVEDELARAASDLRKARAERQQSGPRMLQADEFKAYVARLRTKSLHFKAKKTELAELHCEATILARTEEIITQRDAAVQQALAAAEAAKGVSGIRATQDRLEQVSAAKSELDELKGKTLDDMSAMVTTLNETIASKKTALAPLIKDLRSKRQEVAELEGTFSEKKSAYEALSRSLESAKTRLEGEVKVLREHAGALEGRHHRAVQQLQLIDVQFARVTEELTLHKTAHAAGKDDGAARKKPYRDVVTKRCAEEETRGRHLKDKQKAVTDAHDGNMRQLDLWRDLAALMEGKRAAETGQAVQNRPPSEKEDRLVL